MLMPPWPSHRPGCAPRYTVCTSQSTITPTASAHRTEMWARLPASPPHPDAALSAGPAPHRDVPLTGGRGGSDGGRRPLVGRARLPGLPALWHSRSWIRSRRLLRVWLRLLGRVQLQGPWRVSILQASSSWAACLIAVQLALWGLGRLVPVRCHNCRSRSYFSGFGWWPLSLRLFYLRTGEAP